MVTAHTDKAYDRELQELRDKLLAMAGKVEAAIAGSVRAITERDPELARSIKVGDAEVGQYYEANRKDLTGPDMARLESIAFGSRQDAEAALGGRGRVLVRYSGTEPLVRVMIEGLDEAKIHALAGNIVAAIQAAIG